MAGGGVLAQRQFQMKSLAAGEVVACARMMLACGSSCAVFALGVLRASRLQFCGIGLCLIGLCLCLCCLRGCRGLRVALGRVGGLGCLDCCACTGVTKLISASTRPPMRLAFS